MALILPTREFVGLLSDVYPFASPDDEDTAWHRVVIRWDGTRLHAYAGQSGLLGRMAWMSWGSDDGDQPELPLDWDPHRPVDADWELAILPQDAKEIATKFKVSAKEGDMPLVIDGNADRLSVRRNSDLGQVALTGVVLARPWDDNSPDVPDQIGRVAAETQNAPARKSAVYSGFALADFVNPKVVRQRGSVVLHFGKGSSYIEIGRHFRGAIMQGEEDRPR